MRLPIGQDNFAELIDGKFDFVDKSLFVRDVLEEVSKVIVITRPRRFGKTLNLSMLQYFFAAEAYERKTQGLFDGLKITAAGELYMQHQGQYPVIFITLKGVRNLSFQHSLKKLSLLLSNLYSQYNYLLESESLDPAEKNYFMQVREGTLDQSELEEALYRLTNYLFKHHKTKVWLLIDEYDTPIHSAFLHDYYSEMIALIRGLFGTVLKTNPYLEKAVITGILRIAKESLFSGLNNVKVYTLLDREYADYFGFTETETTELLRRANLTKQADEIRHWYNGYLIGDTVIYNPWSIAECLNGHGTLRPYWVNTSSNDLIHHLLARGDEALKNDLALLLADQPITASIDEKTVFGSLEKDNHALWSLLLFSGYLKAIKSERVGAHLQCLLMPPNYEVKILYRDIVQAWLSDALGYSNYVNFLKSLTEGKVEEFTLRLQSCLQTTLSIFDVTGHQPEKFYHGFVLGLMVSLETTHEVQSNKESGFGRYDVMLIPKDRAHLGIVLEFKTAHNPDIPLATAAQEALQQTFDRNYAQVLRAKGIQQILHLGLAFRQKEVAVASK